MPRQKKNNDPFEIPTFLDRKIKDDVYVKEYFRHKKTLYKIGTDENWYYAETNKRVLKKNIPPTK